jgi:glycosyltransferase involved in cell wall biosynthesis
MACGTPVVVSPIDGVADIVGASEAGRILAEATPSGLASSIRELLAALPARAATRLHAEQFDWHSTTDGQMALFREILERRSKARPAPTHAD